MATTSSSVRHAGVGAALLLTGVAGFQTALAFGAPWGANVYGGRVATPDGTLPAGYRAASAAAVPLLGAAAWGVAGPAGVVDHGRARPVALARATWGIAAYLAVNTVGNLASTSTIERWGLGTVTAVASGLALHVARSAPRLPAAGQPIDSRVRS